MAETASPSTGHCYGVARVCRAWDVARSSFYAARQAATGGTAPAGHSARRGPRPAVSDEALLAAIRADLARSPWTGEGHRKVWARLRALDGIRVSRRRVPRLMRERALLSPHRARPRPGGASHDRRIATEAPDIMWATDATQVTTVEDGKVWLFGVAEHWNAELLGWHVAKRGTRHEAIQAVGMAVRERFGHLEAGAARGLALRHDHGSAFMADVFQRQIRFRGHGAELRLRRRARDERMHRAPLPHPQGAGRAWPHLPDHRRCARRRPGLRHPLQRGVADREERPPQPG
jgi:putative transposase